MYDVRNLVVVALFSGGLAVLTTTGCNSDSNQPTSTGGTSGTSGGGTGGAGKAGGGGSAAAGASGSAGATGAAGAHGSAGASGAAGTHGTGGAGGAAGTHGTGGAAGVAGAGGAAGMHGTGGAGGVAGAAGSHGAGGSAGGAAAGSTGTTGAAGAGAAGTGGVVENSTACLTCEQTGTVAGTCAGTSPVGQGTSLSNFGCDGLTTTTDKANCLALLGCLRGSACQTAIHNATSDYGEAGTYPQPFDDPHPCLCGNTTLATCVSMTSGWTGVCAPQFVAAAAADGQTVSNAYTSPSSPVGLAVNLSICDIDNSCQSSCMIPQ